MFIVRNIGINCSFVSEQILCSVIIKQSGTESKSEKSIIEMFVRTPGSKEFLFVFFVKRTKNNTSNSREETVKKRTVFRKEMMKFLRNSKNAMTVRTINEFKTHGSSSVNGIHVSTRRAETTVAVKRNKFKIATTGAAIHGTAKRRVTTTKHSVNVINDGTARMSDI